MQRRNFIATGILGSGALINFPTFSKDQRIATSPAPFYIAPKNPLSPGPGGADVRTIIKSAQTNAQFSNIEVAFAPKQMGPSPHIHDQLDELMYVLEGTATVLIGKDVYEVKAGGWNFRPRGIVHSFWNAHDTPLRFVDCFFNQNFEDYLEELFHKIIPEMLAQNLSPSSPSIKKQLDALDNTFGIAWFHEQRQGIIEQYGLTR